MSDATTAIVSPVARQFLFDSGFLSTAADFLFKSHVLPILDNQGEAIRGLKVETLQCEFFYNGTRIPDPAPDLSVEQIVRMSFW